MKRVARGHRHDRRLDVACADCVPQLAAFGSALTLPAFTWRVLRCPHPAASDPAHPGLTAQLSLTQNPWPLRATLALELASARHAQDVAALLDGATASRTRSPRLCHPAAVCDRNGPGRNQAEGCCGPDGPSCLESLIDSSLALQSTGRASDLHDHCTTYFAVLTRPSAWWKNPPRCRSRVPPGFAPSLIARRRYHQLAWITEAIVIGSSTVASIGPVRRRHVAIIARRSIEYHCHARPRRPCAIDVSGRENRGACASRSPTTDRA